jgi:replicative DNA helicase
LANKQLNEISLAAHDAKEGRMDIEEFQALLHKFNELTESQEDEDKEEDVFISDDLAFLVDNTYKKPGLRWRLKTLNEMLGSLRKGDFGFVFARPETGKTTFLASEISFMAEQLEEEDGPILWINNEEQSEKPMLRCIQASTGCRLEQLLSNKEEFGLLYRKKTKGKIKIIKDIAAVHKKTVEKLCHKFRPSLVVIDQLDKIVGFENDREDLKLGAIYQWARELAKMYAPVIAICQADGTGEGVKWLTMSNVANAKTAKQAEADFILGIGKINDPGYDNIRYLHLSKNKLLGDADTLPDQRHGRREVIIDPAVARYLDIT